MPAAGIFVSYRRQDSAGHAGRIVDTLERRFGKRRVFMDVDEIQAGTDFVEAIDNALDRCFAFVAVIGPDWLEIRDSDGRRRLDDSDDFIRRELSHALQRRVRVVPVLVKGATMPTAERLPEDLRRLARIQALNVSDERWEYDTGRLMEVLGPRSSYGRTFKIAAAVAALAIAGVIAYWQLAKPLSGPASEGPAQTETGAPAAAASDPPAGSAALSPQEPSGAGQEPEATPATEVPVPAQEPVVEPQAEAPGPSPEPVVEPPAEAPALSQESAEQQPGVSPPPSQEPRPTPPPDRRAGWCLPGGLTLTGGPCAPGYYAKLALAQGWVLTPESVTVIEPLPANRPRQDVIGWCSVRRLEAGEPLAPGDVIGCKPGSYARARAGVGWMLLPESVIAMEPLPRELPLQDLVGWCLNRAIEPGERLEPGIVGGCRRRLYAGRRLLPGERLARPDLIQGAGRLTDAVLEELVGRCAARRFESGQPFGPGDLQPCG